MSNVDGVGPDVPLEILEGGGTRSKSPYAFDQVLQLPHAMLRLARRFKYGEEHGHAKGNWKKLPVSSFLAHGMQHVFAFMAGDTSEGDPGIHLEAAAWNFLVAVEVYLTGKEEQALNLKRAVESARAFKLVDYAKKRHVPVNANTDAMCKWETNAEAMSVLRHTIERNKVHGRDEENPYIEHVLILMEEINANKANT